MGAVSQDMPEAVDIIFEEGFPKIATHVPRVW
jgi:hypothetical protein